jgi:hypothetical protein
MRTVLPGRLFWRDIGWLMLLISVMWLLEGPGYSAVITGIAGLALIWQGTRVQHVPQQPQRRSLLLMSAACFGGMILGLAVGAAGGVATAAILDLFGIRETGFPQFFLIWMTRGGVFVGLIDAWRQTLRDNGSR